MELKLYNDSVTCKEMILRRNQVREETLEINLPENLPDVISVIDARIVPYMRTKDVESGRVVVGGVGQISILYYTDVSPEIQIISNEVKFSGELPNEHITSDCSVSALVTCVNCEARIVNSRKLILRYELLYSVSCLRSGEVYSWRVPENTDTLCFKCSEHPVTLPSACGEKTFVLSDSVKPTGAGDIGDILFSDTAFSVEEVKSVGAKVVVKGTAATRFTYRAGESDIGTFSFKSPFSQIVDMDGDTEGEHISVQIMATGLYLDKDLLDDLNGNTVAVEINAAIQCVSFRKVMISKVDDAYSTDYGITCEKSASNIKSSQHHTREDAVAMMIEGSGANSLIWWDIQFCGAPEIKDGELVMPVALKLLVKADNGDIGTVYRRFEYKKPANMEVCDDLSLVCTDWGDVSAIISGEGIQVGAPFKAQLSACDCALIETIEQVLVDEEDRKDKYNSPSITAYRVKDGDSLWTIAKKYSAVREIIMKLNALESDAIPQPGSILLIPKC